MASLNKKPIPIYTHEGGVAKRTTPYQSLRRTVLSCMLWEDSFYEDGEDISSRITTLCRNVSDEVISELAIEARDKYYLRHVPLLLAKILAERSSLLTAKTLYHIIQRPDELSEYLSIYWKNGRTPVSAQSKKGLAKAFTKFNAYQLQKYNNQKKTIKLKDVLRIVHPKPMNEEQSNLWGQLKNNCLPTPETWETMLSAGKNKKETFEYLIHNKKLGGLALLRNLRNMSEAGVENSSIISALQEMKTEKILPYRFIAAGSIVPAFEPWLEAAMLKCLENKPYKLKGNTILLVDVSGSMDHPLSRKSDLQRIDAACGLAMMAREMCESINILTFSNATVSVPPRRGFALRDAILQSQSHGSTYMGNAVHAINKNKKYDNLIVITDEQTGDNVPDPIPNSRGFIINISTEKNGIGYGKWMHIDGFSEAVFDYIIEFTNNFDNQDAE